MKKPRRERDRLLEPAKKLSRRSQEVRRRHLTDCNVYHLSMIVLTTIGTVGTVWASWRMHQAFKAGKIKVVGIVKK